MDKILLDNKNDDGLLQAVPLPQKNYAANSSSYMGTIRKKHKSHNSASAGNLELFESKAQITAALVKSLYSHTNEFLMVISKLNADQRKDTLTDFESECVKYSKELLQKVTDVLSTLKIFHDDQAMYDALLRPINALVTTTVNIRPRFYDEENADQKAFISLTRQKLQDIVHTLANELRQIVAIQLSYLHYSVLANGNLSIATDANGTAKVLKTIKVISTLRRYLFNKSDSELVMKGFLLKKSKGDTFAKNWKKYFFALDNDKLMYSDKETDLKTGKILFTSSFSRVEDGSDVYQKNYTIVLHGDHSVVLCAATESEYNEWMMKLAEVIRNIRNIKADSDSGGKQFNVSWSVFKESELRDLLKAYDREEKYQIEQTRVLYLQKMTDIIARIAKVDPSDTKANMQLPQTYALIDSKSQEYNDLIRRQAVFHSMPIDKQDFIKMVRKDPSAYLAEIIGFGINDFSN